MRLLTWNIRHGGGKRVPLIVAEIERLRPDVAVLTECRETPPGLELERRLHELGLRFQTIKCPLPRTNKVVVAANQRAEFSYLPRRLGRDFHRVALARYGDVHIVGAYFPSVGTAIRPVFAKLLRLARQLTDQPAIITGDLNTGLNGSDCNGAVFTCAPEMETLIGSGWTDAWRSVNGHAREFTWFSHKGNGFRIDHAFVSRSMLPRARRAFYDHDVRARGISDHSALVVDFE